MNGDNSGEGRPDLPPLSVVNERLRAFVAEYRARPKGERRPFAESDATLCAMAETALAYQEEAQRKLAEALAKVERLELNSAAGGYSDQDAKAKRPLAPAPDRAPRRTRLSR